MTIRGSLVIPSLNRADYLLETVQSFLDLKHRQWEILVVDQSDGTSRSLAELAAANDNLSYHHVTEKGLPNARNVGIDKAVGEIVAFVDDDRPAHTLSPPSRHALVAGFGEEHVLRLSTLLHRANVSEPALTMRGHKVLTGSSWQGNAMAKL